MAAFIFKLTFLSYSVVQSFFLEGSQQLPIIKKPLKTFTYFVTA